jgi:Domain of unknown function (DUF4266)
MRSLCLAAALCALCASGCAAVAPYQRGYLARDDMAFEADPGTAKSIEKTFAAKEAASGGAGVGGGGCGCN